MISFRGDVHKFFLKLKKIKRMKNSIYEIAEIKEIGEIRRFYEKFSVPELIYIRYKMIKEKNAMGIIPLVFGSLPWLGFIFSKQLQNFLFENGTYLWAWFLILYSFILTFGLTIHYKEKGWAALHIEMVESILHEKQK